MRSSDVEPYYDTSYRKAAVVLGDPVAVEVEALLRKIYFLNKQYIIVKPVQSSFLIQDLVNKYVELFNYLEKNAEKEKRGIGNYQKIVEVSFLSVMTNPFSHTELFIKTMQSVFKSLNIIMTHTYGEHSMTHTEYITMFNSSFFYAARKLSTIFPNTPKGAK